MSYSTRRSDDSLGQRIRSNTEFRPHTGGISRIDAGRLLDRTGILEQPTVDFRRQNRGNFISPYDGMVESLFFDAQTSGIGDDGSRVIPGTDLPLG